MTLKAQEKRRGMFHPSCTAFHNSLCWKILNYSNRAPKIRHVQNYIFGQSKKNKHLKKESIQKELFTAVL